MGNEEIRRIIVPHSPNAHSRVSGTCMTGTLDPSCQGHRFDKASGFYPACFDLEAYRKRTARNHYWIGGLKGQEIISNLSLGVAGLGGMGSNIAEHLVRLGVGHLRIADLDRIEVSNLNRQVIARRNNLGMSKVEAGVQDLRRHRGRL